MRKKMQLTKLNMNFFSPVQFTISICSRSYMALKYSFFMLNSCLMMKKTWEIKVVFCLWSILILIYDKQCDQIIFVKNRRFIPTKIWPKNNRHHSTVKTMSPLNHQKSPVWRFMTTSGHTIISADLTHFLTEHNWVWEGRREIAWIYK